MKAVVLDDQGRYVRDCAVEEVGVLAISGPNASATDRGSTTRACGLTAVTEALAQHRRPGTPGRGRLFLADRAKKGTHHCSGHNIDPITIEEPLHQHPDVQVVAAVGRPRCLPTPANCRWPTSSSSPAASRRRPS